MALPDKPDRPKVNILVSGLDIGGAHGGAERFGLELSRNLPPDVFEVTLIAFWRRDTNPEKFWLNQLSNAQVPVRFAASWPGRFTLSAYRAGLKRLADFQRTSGPADIFHSHYQMGTLAAVYLRNRDLVDKALRTAHVSREWGVGFPSWVMRQVFTNWLYPIYLDAEVGVSQAIVDALQRHPGSRLGRKTPVLIHNAIYPAGFQGGGALPNGMSRSADPGRLVVGSIGRMTRQKGYTYLLEAIPSVLERYPEVQFILIGDGELRPDLEAQASRLGIGPVVTFAGQQEDVLPFLRQMDLFVLPSIYEGLPTVILESMACGVPVVATDIPGTRELIQDHHNGWLVEPRNPLALADVLIEALSSQPERRRMAEQAFQTVERFRIEKIAGQYAALYLDLLG